MSPSSSPTQKFYDRLSLWYDRMAEGSEGPFCQMGLEMLAPQAGERILEIGCGTGSAITILAKKYAPGGLALGLDLSAGMLRQAHKKNPAPPAALVQADALRLPLAEAAFEAVFFSFSFELFDAEAIPLLLAECRRVLHPGGRLAIVTLYRPPQPGTMVRFYEWLHRRFPNAIDCRPLDTRPYLEAAAFRIHARRQGNMWGLPVEMILAGL